MKETKIVFSEQELHLLNDSSIWTSKRSLTTKLYEVIGKCAEQIKEENEAHLHTIFPTVRNSSGKITKGENYLGRPYVIFDYPNVFKKDEMVSIRTLFWFGELLSCSLIISGKHLTAVSSKTISLAASKKEAGLYICIADNPWQHHFNKENMKPLREMTKRDIQNGIKKYAFLKIGKKTTLTQPSKWKNFILESYRIFIPLIT